MFVFSWAILLTLFLTTAAAEANPIRLEQRQGSNTVSKEYPNSQTAAFNFTTWLLPVSKVDAQKLAGGRTLLAPKDLPEGFDLKDDEHAIQITAAYLTDYRQNNVLALREISALNLFVPWVQGVESSKVPFSYHVVTFNSQIIPALIGTLFQGANAYPAFFDPKHAAYRAIPDGFTFNVDYGLFQNFLDVPGLTSPAFQSSFSRSESSTLPVEYVLEVMNMPYILSGSKTKCSKTQFLLKDSFANPFRVKGQVNTGSALTGKHFSFPEAQGVTATVQYINDAKSSPCASFV
ncbi:hypothetical protein V8E36_002889 [Tilletia maclaganii]